MSTEKSLLHIRVSHNIHILDPYSSIIIIILVIITNMEMQENENERRKEKNERKQRRTGCQSS